MKSSAFVEKMVGLQNHGLVTNFVRLVYEVHTKNSHNTSQLIRPICQNLAFASIYRTNSLIPGKIQKNENWGR